MILRLLAICSLCLLVGCTSKPVEQLVVPPVGSAKVVVPDRLYFKNIRAIHYNVQEDHKKHFNVYTHSQLATAEPDWQLNITDDWLHDQAWLHFTATDPGLFYRLGAESEEMVLLEHKQFSDVEAMRLFARRLAAPYEICYRKLSSTVSSCLTADNTMRIALRETIHDYLRLTDQD